MRRSIKQQKQRKIVIVSVIGLLCVMSVGYAAFQTNLNITAKGSIVEKEISIKEIKDLYCNQTSGDGLYIDTYETGRCVYKGVDPNNYLEIDNTLWRILAIESDGTLKIMKNDSIGKKLWDTGVGAWGYNDWSRPAVVNSYLNNDYYGSLSDDFKAIIENHVWNTGAVTHGNNDLANQIEEEKSITWRGNVGLISVSDYIKANSNISECGNLSLNNSNYETCHQTNFLVKSERFWTITAYDKIILNSSSVVYRIGETGGIGAESAGYNTSDILPNIYLKNTIIFEGKGTETYPYVIKSY